MKKALNRGNRQAGFTLLEMMLAVAILTIVMGVVFSNEDMVQKRYNTEDAKTDMIQESREFVDQLTRDLEQAGFPAGDMYTATPADTSTSKAVGLAAVSATDVIFEGDVNGDGTVWVVEYQLDSTQYSGKCPCKLKRSVVAKTAGTAATSVVPSFSTEVERVLNSAGSTSAYTLVGADAHSQAFDTLYSQYKTFPIFTFYDVSGNQITVPNDLTGANLTTGSNSVTLSDVHSIVVTVNVLARLPDQQTQVYPAISLRGF